MSPRQAWRAIQAGLPREAILSTDIGNNCAIGNAYPSFERTRKYLAPGMSGPCGYAFPAITMVIFRNFQWGAEKRNAILWYDDNFVGTERDPKLSYARIAEGCGFKGVRVETQRALTEALREAGEAQARGVTTFIEVMLNQELGEPFRRDATRKPVKVAGIDRAEMRPRRAA